MLVNRVQPLLGSPGVYAIVCGDTAVGAGSYLDILPGHAAVTAWRKRASSTSSPVFVMKSISFILEKLHTVEGEMDERGFAKICYRKPILFCQSQDFFSSGTF